MIKNNNFSKQWNGMESSLNTTKSDEEKDIYGSNLLHWTLICTLQDKLLSCPLPLDYTCVVNAVVQLCNGYIPGVFQM